MTVTVPSDGLLANANVRSSPSASVAVTWPVMTVSSSPETARSAATGASLTGLTVTVTVAKSPTRPSSTSTTNESVPLKSWSPTYSKVPSELTVTEPLDGSSRSVKFRSSPSMSDPVTCPVMTVSSSPETARSSATGGSFSGVTVIVTVATFEARPNSSTA